jgi:O-antigen/teichoic acid export membrane protein
MLPRLAPLTRKEDVRQLQSSWLVWLNGLLTPGVIMAIAFSGPFFRLWIGAALGSQASPVAAILLVGCWFHGIGHIASAVLVGRSRPEVVTRLLLLCLFPYLLLLYFATSQLGVIGAAAAWTIRAACDLFLFLGTHPRSTDLRSVATSALFVACGMSAALTLDWMSAPYWGVMALIIAAACYQNRAVLISSVDEIRKLALRASSGP